jgi:hypothetical protein
MVVDYENLTQETFKSMGFKETVTGIPHKYSGTDLILTKTQILTLLMIYNHSVGGFGQIRNYTGQTLANGAYISTKSVPYALEDKGLVHVSPPRRVSRRTGRTKSGFETKQEGGSVTTTNDELLDLLAEKLGFGNRFSESLETFAVECLQSHPNA